MKKIRPIAIFLPQFHPIPENDAWWGVGFTEWRNVVKAKPRFRGHYQPHLPADLGFYDLRLPEIRQQQADMAKKYGIYGFCYYHYWFNGRQVLERPVNEILESGSPDFPFMLCWANENWTRVWDAGAKNILLEQKYSDSDHRKHAEALIPFFKDSRYIKISGKPVFSVYRDSTIPNVKRMTDIFRKVAAEHDIELYLCRFDRQSGTLEQSPTESGFDAAIEFQPLSKSFKKYQNIKRYSLNFLILKLLRRFSSIYPFKLPFLKSKMASCGLLDLKINYSDFVEFDCLQPKEKYTCFPGVSPSWDNSSRRVDGDATIFYGSTPAKFAYWVQNKISKFSPPSEEENLLFINAWNEWAEGNHLEPCEKFNYSYLEAFKEALKDSGV